MTDRLTLTELDGTKTIFARKTTGVWVTEQVIGPEDNATTTYAHDGAGSVTWILAPAPTGVACRAPADQTSAALDAAQQPGCRALHLNYTGTGTAKRLATVDLRIYNPRTGADTSWPAQLSWRPLSGGDGSVLREMAQEDEGVVVKFCVSRLGY